MKVMSTWLGALLPAAAVDLVLVPLLIEQLDALVHGVHPAVVIQIVVVFRDRQLDLQLLVGLHDHVADADGGAVDGDLFALGGEDLVRDDDRVLFGEEVDRDGAAQGFDGGGLLRNAVEVDLGLVGGGPVAIAAGGPQRTPNIMPSLPWLAAGSSEFLVVIGGGELDVAQAQEPSRGSTKTEKENVRLSWHRAGPVSRLIMLRSTLRD